MTIQIFVTFRDIKSRVIELDEGTTCAAALPLILNELNQNLPAHAEAFLANARGKIPSHAVLQREGNYTLAISVPFVPRIDPEVLLLLNIRLQRYISYPKPKHFVFISTGSHINGNKGLEEAGKQQCPSDLIKYCQSLGLKLSIILIDDCFMNDSDGGQIYNHDRNWQPSGELLAGRVRHFKHAQTGFMLSTYQSHLENWGKASTHLADIELEALGSRLNNADGQLLIRMYNGDITYNSHPEIRLGTH